MDTPEDTSIHPKGLALLLNQPLRFHALDSFDRGVVYSACTVVVRTITPHQRPTPNPANQFEQTSEKIVLGQININTSSPCWSFFQKVNSRSSTLRITSPAGEPLGLTERLGRLLSALAYFFRSDQTLPEVWKMYNIATAVVTDLSMEVKQTNAMTSHETPADPHDATSSNSEEHTHAKAANQSMRGFKFALTLTLIMNGVLSTHYPDCEKLANFRRQFTDETLPPSAKAGQLMPMGAGFVGMFLDHVWAIEDDAADVPAAWDIYGKGLANERSSAFSRRLEKTLESLI